MSRKGQSTRSGQHGQGEVVFNVDLNALPASSCFTLDISDSFLLPSESVSTRGEAAQQAVPIIDVDSSDDDKVVVVPASNQVFEVPNQSTDTFVIDIPDEDSDDHQTSPDVAARTLLRISSANSGLQNNPRGRNIIKYNADKRLDAHVVKKTKEPEQPKEPNFLCAVCKGELVNETSTICGHIFCENCIKAAIRAQKKCPTCRTRLTAKKIHRVYLPTR